MKPWWPVSAALVLALGACTQAPDQVVPYTAEGATISVGETLVVDFGDVSSSIGDGWQLTTPPDDAVLSGGQVIQEYEGQGEPPPGSASHLVYEFTAKAPGTTTIGFTYSYRGEVGDPEGRTADPTPEIRVTVVE